MTTGSGFLVSGKISWPDDFVDPAKPQLNRKKEDTEQPQKGLNRIFCYFPDQTAGIPASDATAEVPTSACLP